MREMGLETSPEFVRLEGLRRRAEDTLESEWTDELRKKYEEDIEIMKMEIGAMFGANQPGFRSHPW
jgi:hypothetical protein